MLRPQHDSNQYTPEFDAAIEERGLYGDYRKKLRLTRPDIFLRWKITETCNYTCSYCTAWKTVNTKLYEIPVDQLLEIARIFTDQFSNISLRITGGEPSVKRNYATS